MRRHDCADDQRDRLEPLLLPQRPATGGPATYHRTILSGILWIPMMPRSCHPLAQRLWAITTLLNFTSVMAFLRRLGRPISPAAQMHD